MSWTDVPDARLIDPTDVVVRVDTTTICGTDLHILGGDVPAVIPGRVLGHEAVGVITEVGSAVTSLAIGDRVLVPAITSCGKCGPCKTAMPSHCASVGGIGWIFGHLIDGTQAEYVRVPYAETSVHVLPDAVANEQAIFLADILPTGFEIGVQNGHVQPGDTVVVVGVGPVGLASIRTAGLYGAATVVAVDLSEARLKRSLSFGADETINSGTEDVRARVLELTNGLGAHVVVEAVGIPATFELCTTLVRPEVALPTSVCTASPSTCISKTCGSTTSRSPRDSSTAPPFRPCWTCWPTANSTPAPSALIPSVSTR